MILQYMVLGAHAQPEVFFTVVFFLIIFLYMQPGWLTSKFFSRRSEAKVTALLK